MEIKTAEMETLLAEVKAGWGNVSVLPDEVTRLRESNARMETELKDMRRLVASRAGGPLTVARRSGEVSVDCARALGSIFILHCANSGKLEALASHSAQRDGLLGVARETLGLTARAALTTSDVPLPSTYSGEIRELISEYGVVRRKMTHYPIGMGTAKPPRTGTRPAFGSIVMSATFGEKSPSFTFASLESHKLGGIVRVPRELDEQSVVPLGRFLARYGAVEFARAEDTWGFLADGSPTYENVKGIVTVARENSKTVTLAATKTKPSDATLDDLRALRRMVNKAALNGRMSGYFLDSTWETRLAAFRTSAEPNVYLRLPDGSAILDGYPIYWTDVLEPFGTAAAPDKAIAVFGAPAFWWFGEHGSPRVDTSEHIWFANDQLAVRFIEEIDFDYIALDAMSALITAAG
jgi:HK97 family phage major capsid protein